MPKISVFRQRMATRLQIWAVFAVRTAFLLKLLQHPVSREKTTETWRRDYVDAKLTAAKREKGFVV